MILKWFEKGIHDIWKTDGCEFAEVPVLSHSVGPAGFEVYMTDDELWTCYFWHGNRGHRLGDRFPTKKDAKSAAQREIDKLSEAIR